MVGARWHRDEVSAEVLIAVGVFGFRKQTRGRYVFMRCGAVAACKAGVIHFF